VINSRDSLSGNKIRTNRETLPFKTLDGAHDKLSTVKA